MRKFKQFMLLVMTVSLVTLTGCSSDDDSNDDGGSGGAEFLTAKIDGSNFAAAQDPVVIVGAVSTNGILNVQGGTNDGDTMRITIHGYDGPGTYAIGSDLTNATSLFYLELPQTSWTASSIVGGSGTIKVTSDDGTTVEGTFSGELISIGGNPNITITDGKFKALFDN